MTPIDQAVLRDIADQRWSAMMRLPETERIKKALLYLIGRISSSPTSPLSIEETLKLIEVVTGPDAPPSPKPVEAAGSRPASCDICKRVEVEDYAGVCHDIGCPNDKPRKPAPPEAPAPRRMMANPKKCMVADPCFHNADHDEVTEENSPQAYYKQLCGYHGCQPVPPPEATNAGRRWIVEEVPTAHSEGRVGYITDDRETHELRVVSELQPITRERLQELEFVFEGGAKHGVVGCKAGIRAVLKLLGLPMADEK